MFQFKWDTFLSALVGAVVCSGLLFFSSCGGNGGAYFYDFADPIIVNITSSSGGKGGIFQNSQIRS